MLQAVYNIIVDINNLSFGFTGIPQVYSINTYWYPQHKQFRYQLLKMTEQQTQNHEDAYSFVIEGDFHDDESLYSYLKSNKTKLANQFMTAKK